MRKVALVVLAVIALSFTSCTTTSAFTQLQPTFRSNLQLLNCVGNSYHIGTIYSVHGTSIHPILDVIANAPSGDLALWTQVIDLPNPRTIPMQMETLFRVKHGLTPKEFTVNLNVVLGPTKVYQLDNKYELMEVLNRPFTGFAYNREAESKIHVMRSQLSQELAIASANNARGEVALCAQIAITSGCKLTYIAYWPKGIKVEPKTVFQSMLNNTITGTDLTPDLASATLTSEETPRRRLCCWVYEVPLSGEIVSSLQFSKISSDPSAALPRVDFVLAGDIAVQLDKDSAK